MSRDYHLLLDTKDTIEELRKTLTTSCGVKATDDGWFVSDAVNLQLEPVRPSDVNLTEPAIPKATYIIDFVPNSHAENRVYKIFRMAVTLMQKHPGDAALAAQDATTAMLRLDGVVYLDPAQTLFDRVTDDDFPSTAVVHRMPGVQA